MNTLSRAQQLLEAPYWSVYDDTSLEVVFHDKSSHKITDEELKVHHQNLPAVIRAIDAWQSSAGYRYINGHVVQQTLVLMAAAYAMTFHDGSHHVQIIRVDKFAESEMDNTMMDVRGTKLYLEYVQYENQTIPMIVDSLWCHTGVAKAALDRTNPGWRERWALSTTLDLPLAEKLPFLFPPQNAITRTADLPIIDFQ